MKKKLLGITVMLFLSYYLIQRRSFSPWKEYYQATCNRVACDLVVSSEKSFQQKGKAIDIGCGAGSDSKFLAERGWEVLSIDAEKDAFKWISKEKYSNISTLLSKFEKINWHEIAPADLVTAINTLPFVKKTDFNSLWINLISKINKEGRFAGVFFGPNFQETFGEDVERMTFHTKDEVMDLFKDFTIEYFEEVDQLSESAIGNMRKEHRFKVIAKKNS